MIWSHSPLLSAHISSLILHVYNQTGIHLHTAKTFNTKKKEKVNILYRGPFCHQATVQYSKARMQSIRKTIYKINFTHTSMQLSPHLIFLEFLNYHVKETLPTRLISTGPKMTIIKFANSIYPDEVASHMTPHLGINCLPSSLRTLNRTQF